MPPAPGAEANHGFADAVVPATSVARQPRAKVAGKSLKRQQQVRMAADVIAPAKKDDGVTKPKRVWISTGRPRGRPRKSTNHGFADDDMPGSGSSKTPGAVAASQDATAAGSRGGARSIRIVPVSSSDGPRRGRGRPKGSLGIKKRAANAAPGGPTYVNF